MDMGYINITLSIFDAKDTLYSTALFFISLIQFTFLPARKDMYICARIYRYISIKKSRFEHVFPHIEF